MEHHLHQQQKTESKPDGQQKAHMLRKGKLQRQHIIDQRENGQTADHAQNQVCKQIEKSAPLGGGGIFFHTLILYSKTNYYKYSTRNICRKVDMLVEIHSRLFCREFGFGYADKL